MREHNDLLHMEFSDQKGIPVEDVPSQTRKVIESLFPPAMGKNSRRATRNGADLLQSLCSLAVHKQYDSPNLGNIAVFIPHPGITSISDLASQIGWSHDTLDGYILLLSGFGIFKKGRHWRRIDLWLPLDTDYKPDFPAIIEALRAIFDSERGYRGRIQKLAVKALSRFVVLYPEIQQTTEFSDFLGFLHPEVSKAVEMLEQLLQATGTGQLNLGAICVTKREAQNRHRPVEVDSERDDSNQNRMKEVDSDRQLGEIRHSESTGQCRSNILADGEKQQNLTIRGDSKSQKRGARSSESTTPTRLPRIGVRTKGTESQSRTQNTTKLKILTSIPVTGNNDIIPESFLDIESGTGETPAKNIQEQEEALEETLARIFEGRATKGNIISYRNLIEKHDSHVIRAAFLATMRRKHFPGRQGPSTKPGGYFTQRCREYTATGIPEYIRPLIETYAGLSWEETDRQFGAKARALPQSTPPHSRTVPSVSPTIQPMRGADIETPEQAEELIKQIKLAASYIDVKRVRKEQAGKRIWYVIEVVMDGHPGEFASFEDWRSYYQGIGECERLLEELLRSE
jgi:hypothetical protein